MGRVSVFDRKRRREQLMRRQKERCFYCGRRVGKEPGCLAPICDHFKPHHARQPGERHQLVLACEWCDKAKGAMSGPEFQALVQAETATRDFASAMADIKRKARTINVQRFASLRGGAAAAAPPITNPASVEGRLD